MNAEQQARRRALKAERRALDRAAEQIAAEARAADRVRVPSTRSKQARWHHDVARAVHTRQDAYRALRARMAEIAAELARIGGRQ